jgi:hypothetical protein
MAKGVKYRIEYDNFHAQELKIDILFEGFVGSVTSITGSNEPFVKKTEQSSAAIPKGEILDSDFFIEALTGNGFSLSDFTSENYGDIIFNYYKDAVLIYSGVIAPFESSQQLLPDGLTYLSLSGETGLKQLYKETIKNEDDSFLSGRYKIIEVLSKALRLLEVPNTFNIISNVNTLVYIDGVQKNSTLDFFENYIDAEAFKLAPSTWMSAYEAIESILGGIYTLKLEEGKWVISYYLDDTQASKYITTYNYLGVKQTRTSTAKSTRALLSQSVTNGGSEGKLFSKSRLEIKQNIFSLINRLLNPIFAYTAFDVTDWTNETSFSSVEHGGDGSNTTPYYYKINGSVYTPDGDADTEYLESTGFSWNPVGTTDFGTRELAKYHDTDEKLRFNINAIYGTGISGSRVQIIATWSHMKAISEQPTQVLLDAVATYETVTYYYTNDGWTQEEGWYNTGNGTNEEIVPTIPPIRLATTYKYRSLIIGYDYEVTPPTVTVSIKLFRGERKKIGESTVEEVGYTYFVQYYSLTSSIWNIENENILDVGNRVFTSDANTDREALEKIEYNIYGDVAPVAFGSIFETNVSTYAINGFKRLGGSSITDYTLFLAKTYLRGRDSRLSVLNVTLFDDITLESNLFTFEGKTYRIYSYEWESKMNMHKLRLVEIAYSGSSISEVISEREFSKVVSANNILSSTAKIKTIFATDPNFKYTPLKGLELNPYLDGIISFNPTGGFMNLLIEGNEATSGTNYIDALGDVVGFIRPVTNAISFQAVDNFSFDLNSSLLSQNSVFTFPDLASGTFAMASTAWMLGATNVLTEKNYIGSASGAFDIGIKREGIEIVTVKSTGVDLYDNRLDVGSIQYKLDTSQISGEGKVAWNDTHGTLEVGLKGGNVTHRMGQSSFVYVKHADNSGLTKGNIIYPVGSNGVNKTVRLALANTESTSSNTFAVVAENASGGGKAFSVTYGNIEGLDTSDLTEGAAIYLSTTVAGGFTSTQPSAPNHIVLIGFCIRSHANLGVIFVKIQNGFELDEIHNVGISSLANNNLLAYESSTSLWKNKTFIDLGVLSGTGNANEIAYFTTPNTITSLPIATYPSLAEVSYVKGVTSSIQDQIDAQQSELDLKWEYDGNTIGAKKTIGSLDAYDVGIIREGTEIVTIKNTGVNISGVTSSETINAGDTSVNIQSWIYNSYWSLKIEQKNVAGSHIQYNFNQNNNGVETTVMGIKEGKIGFGTEDPTAQHTIYGAGQATNTGVDTTGALGGAILIQDSTVGAYNGGVALFGSGTNSFAGIKGELRDGSNYTLGDLSFQTRNASTDSTLTTRFFIGKDGKVGVGTILPTELFDVNGTGRFTNAKITASAALGYIAVSDSSGSIIWTDPSALNSWQGNYNASTDTPSLNDGTGTYGNWYHVEVAGTNDFGSGNITFALGDRVIYDGSEWIKQTQNYTLNDASASVLGGIKIGSTLEIASGVANQKSGIVTVGTYRSVTVDTYGRVTGGTNSTLAIADGGTGSATQNFVDLTTDQTIAGVKTFSVDAVINGLTVGSGGGDISSNSAFGYLALSSNTDGSNNTAIGILALQSNTTGNWNTASGNYALYSNTTGNSNAAFGDFALFINTTGYQNVANGGSALRSNTIGYLNAAIGFYALYSNTTGNNNTALGYNAGNGITTGSGNTILGANITGLSATLANTLIIGAGGRKDLYGTATGIGIGVALPAEKLDLLGNFKYSGTLKPSGTAGTAGQFLGTDGTNDAWETLVASDISDFATAWTTNYNLITKNSGYNKAFGTTAGTVSEGNHTHDTATASVLGFVKIGTTLEIAAGVVNQKSGIVTASTYRSVTVDTYGRVTGGTNPTTISGYGITDYNSLWDTRLATKTTTNLSEGSNLYFTNARGIAATLSGYSSGAGTISASDTILSAINKLNGNVAALSGGGVGTIDAVLGTGNTATSKYITFLNDGFIDLISVKNLANTVSRGSITLLVSAAGFHYSDRISLVNQQGAIEFGLRADGQSIRGNYGTTNYIREDYGSGAISQKYYIGGVYKGALSAFIDGGSVNMALSAANALYLQSETSSVHVLSAYGMIIKSGTTAATPIHINSTLGGQTVDSNVYIGRTAGTDYIYLNGVKYNFYSGLTFSNGDQLVLQYDSGNSAFFIKKLATPLA